MSSNKDSIVNSAVESTKLGRWQALALATSFIVGTGILVLPILVVQAIGAGPSLLAWFCMTLMAIPLIFIFYKIGLRTQKNISELWSDALGPRFDHASLFITAGAFLFGMPAMIYSASEMLFHFLGWPSTYAGLGAHAILLVLCANQFLPIKKSTKISFYSAMFLVGIIVVVSTAEPTYLREGLSIFSRRDFELDQIFWLDFTRGSVLTFFGYVGWESLGFFSRDLKNPKKDMKFIYWGSFVLIAVLYLMLAAAVSGAAALGVKFDLGLGVMGLVQNPNLRRLLTFAVVVLLLANLNAWVLSGCRLVGSLLPSLSLSFGQATELQKRTKILAYAILVNGLLLFLDIGFFSVADFFMFSNQNWIVLYGGALFYYFKKFTTTQERWIGVLGAASFLFMTSTFAWPIVFTGVIFLVGVGVSFLKPQFL